MSSHREAPGIAFDPAADNTDTYAFRTAGNKVALIASYSPFQLPASGPNFYEFGSDVLYQIHIDNDGDGIADVKYLFEFFTEVRNPSTFLYNTGPVDSFESPNLNRRQTYKVTKASGPDLADRQVIAENVPVPPYNIGPRSTPNYARLESEALGRGIGRNGERVFAGSREDSFFVDIGSVFDLGTLRPVQNLHLISTPAAPGVDTLKDFNVLSIAVEVDIADLTRGGNVPNDIMDPGAVIGVWATAHRRKGHVRERPGLPVSAGPWVQVSRLGNPLVNEVIVPMAEKDVWNALGPNTDARISPLVKQPELAKLLPVLYPNAFPNLRAYTKDRADLHAILLTGIPEGVVPGFQNFTGATAADMLRLNVAVPPTAEPNPLGLIAGDAAGFPNGRRLVDDVTTIELRAVAGVTIPLVDPSYTPDDAAGQIADGSYNPARRNFLSSFPYIGRPHDGYSTPAA